MLNFKKITRSVTIGAAAIAVGITALAAPAANAASGSTWDRVASCESGGNWSTNTGNGYSGGLQFSPSTWKAYGGKGSASNASRSEQIAVAEKVLAGQGWGAWPSCSKKVGASGGSSDSKAAATPKKSTYVQSKSAPVKKSYQAPVQKKSYQAPAQKSYQAPVQKKSYASQYKTKSYAAPTKTRTYAAPAPVAPVVEVPAFVAPAAVKGSGDFYKAKAGDTLESIAKTNGITKGWTNLWAANLDTISNPNAIDAGQKLELPAK